MMNGCLEMGFHGERLVLDPRGAVWWPAEKVLLLADVHLGKSATFRASGIPVPEGETADDLRRIADLVERYNAAGLIILGDLFHSPAHLSRGLMAEFADWRSGLRCELTLLLGNHDPGRGDFEAVPEMRISESLKLSGIELFHDPVQARRDQPGIAGHLHPLCRIGRRGAGSRRMPCFLERDECLILPAFGTFTSGRVVEEQRNWRIFPIAGGRVFEIPPGGRELSAGGSRR